MKKIFTSPVFFALLGLLLFSLLIWFAGPQIKFGGENSAPLASVTVRIFCILILVMLWALNYLRVQLKNKKNNEDLVSDIGKNQQAGHSTQALEEIHQINQRFTEALSTLKKLKFKGRSSTKALYELPWYIIVGPPGSGKTTALVNSGLDFPLADQFGKGALQGVGGTRNCDWWFTNEAVLIDTAGRYTTQDSHRVVDSSAWEGFLDLLKRNRRRRPINGAIVAISLHDLLTQTEEERSIHAKTIRSRLDELMEKLQIRFPVYLMFTKVDLVSGFTEFFEDLGKEDRNQVWGVSLPNASAPGQSPDFDFLSKELEKISRRLYDRVVGRMHQERDVRRRAAINSFPQQMENLQTIVEDFTRKAFVPNRFRMQPYLRGVYFSSGTQDGSPIDRLMTSVAANFGFSRDASNAPSQQGKSFFLTNLFRDVIFPEAELVGANTRYELIFKWARRAAFLGLAGIAAGSLLIWSGSITRHKLSMAEVEGYIDTFKSEKEKVQVRNKDIRVVLPSLNSLAQASVVYDQQDHPWLSGLGMYDPSVDQAADLAYENSLKTVFLPKLKELLEDALTRSAGGDDLLDTFRIYMMLNQHDHLETKKVNDWFNTFWAQRFEADITRRQELKSHLDKLLGLKFDPIEVDERIVKNTRSTLLRVPADIRIYEKIKADKDYAFQLELLNEFGESVRSTYKVDGGAIRALTIPGLYTIDSYKNLDFSADSPLISSLAEERWLMGDEGVVFAKENLEEISRKVKDYYLADYSRVWLDVYQNLNVVEFTDVFQAKTLLSSFADPVYSPLSSILQTGLNHTQLTPPVLENLAEDRGTTKVGQVAGLIAGQMETTRVDKQFKDLQLLMRESSRGPAPVDGILQKIQDLQIFVAEIAMAPDAGKKAFEVAKARFESGSSNPVTALKAYATTLPDPVNRWLTDMADQSWKVILGSANGYLSSEWRSRVYTPYAQVLAGKYPLNPSSSDEIAMLDFSEFFKPGGTIDQFSEEFLLPFIDTKNGWRNKGVDNFSLGISSSALTQLSTAAEIKRMFFQGGGEFPSVELELRPLSMSEKHSRFTLELGNTQVEYKHGPKFWKPIKWSGGDDSLRLRIIFEDLTDSIHERTFTGPWALFRLLDASRINKTAASNVYLIEFSVVDNGNMENQITYEAKTKSVNNPLRRGLLTAFKCPERI